MILKDYNEAQKEVTPTQTPIIESGVACGEEKCGGEMMVLDPVKGHPEIPQLKRAHCYYCGWRGWVPYEKPESGPVIEEVPVNGNSV